MQVEQFGRVQIPTFVRTYAEVRPRLSTGDVLFCRKKGLLSKVISVTGPVTHVALIKRVSVPGERDRVVIIESTTQDKFSRLKGVQISYLSDFLWKAHKEESLVWVGDFITPHNFDGPAVDAWCDLQNGKRYSILEALGSGINQLTGGRVPSFNFGNQFTCSGLVAEALSSGCGWLSYQRFFKANPTPSEIANWPIFFQFDLLVGGAL
jgi:hypothetical protein